MLHPAVVTSHAVIKPNIQGKRYVWIHCMCEARICLSSDIAQRPQNPKKNKATFSQSQMVCLRVLFWQPFPAVVILPNGFNGYLMGGPSPISRPGAAAFTSQDVDLCFLPHRKPSILPLVGHQKRAALPCTTLLVWMWRIPEKTWAACLEGDSACLLERERGPHRINLDLCSIKHLTGNPLFFL